MRGVVVWLDSIDILIDKMHRLIHSVLDLWIDKNQ